MGYTLRHDSINMSPRPFWSEHALKTLWPCFLLSEVIESLQKKVKVLFQYIYCYVYCLVEVHPSVTMFKYAQR